MSRPVKFADKIYTAADRKYLFASKANISTLQPSQFQSSPKRNFLWSLPSNTVKVTLMSLPAVRCRAQRFGERTARSRASRSPCLRRGTSRRETETCRRGPRTGAYRKVCCRPVAPPRSRRPTCRRERQRLCAQARSSDERIALRYRDPIGDKIGTRARWRARLTRRSKSFSASSEPSATDSERPSARYETPDNRRAVTPPLGRRFET
jgi:hypothetical protein